MSDAFKIWTLDKWHIEVENRIKSCYFISLSSLKSSERWNPFRINWPDAKWQDFCRTSKIDPIIFLPCQEFYSISEFKFWHSLWYYDLGSQLLVVQKSCHFASGQLILKGHFDYVILEELDFQFYMKSLVQFLWN